MDLFLYKKNVKMCTQLTAFAKNVQAHQFWHHSGKLHITLPLTITSY